jgi:hypothetical protein
MNAATPQQSAKTKQILELIQFGFANMFISLEFKRLGDKDASVKEAEEIQAKVANKLQAIADELFENDDSSLAMDAIVNYGKRLSEEFLLDYHSAEKKNGRSDENSG